MPAVRIRGPRGWLTVSPKMLAMLSAHLDGPHQVHIRGNVGRTWRAIYRLGLVHAEGSPRLRPRQSIITRQGRQIVRTATNGAGQ